jgi:hypothetical protein
MKGDLGEVQLPPINVGAVTVPPRVGQQSGRVTSAQGAQDCPPVMRRDKQLPPDEPCRSRCGQRAQERPASVARGELQIAQKLTLAPSELRGNLAQGAGHGSARAASALSLGLFPHICPRTSFLSHGGTEYHR